MWLNEKWLIIAALDRLINVYCTTIEDFTQFIRIISRGLILGGLMVLPKLKPYVLMLYQITSSIRFLTLKIQIEISK